MTIQMQAVFDDIATALNEGRPEEAAMHYHVPLVIYSGAHIEILENELDVVEMLTRITAMCAENGAQTLQPEILDMQTPEDGRIPVKVAWTFYDDAKCDLAQGLLTYFCRHKPNGVQIEMLDYHQRAFPQSLPVEQRPARAV